MTKQKFDSVVIHYDEIGLKGKNRRGFENLLEKNILSKLNGGVGGSRKERGRITLDLNLKANLEIIEETLKNIPGISYFSFSKSCDYNYEKVEKESVLLVEGIHFETFKINAKRSNKNFPLNSNQINNQLGKTIQDHFQKKAKMEGPDLTLKVEVADRKVFLSTGDVRGIGGLPTEKGKKVLALISGGFDSPVAAYMMMKRGCEVELIHFINENQKTTAVKDKVKQLTKALSKFQNKTILHIVPFEELQKQIIMNVHSTLRMLIYRRFMIQIASVFSDQIDAKFLIVGDSLSQVASQTIDNLKATYHDTGKHILSPLIGLNKNEIMDIARRIGTYDISKIQHDDCCSYFVPKHPELRARSKMIEENELKIESAPLIQNAIKNIEKIEF